MLNVAKPDSVYKISGAKNLSLSADEAPIGRNDDAIEEFLKSDWDLEAEHHFDDIELEVLHDFRDLLYIFHIVQELVSAEKTPTLSIVLPLYEQLTVMLADFKVVKPQLVHAIEPGIAKLKGYLAETRSTKAYAMAMVLNPTIKFSWLQEHWSASEYALARQTTFNILLEFRRAMRRDGLLSPSVSDTQTPGQPTFTPPTQRPLARTPSESASAAAQAQASGMARLNKLARSISESALNSTLELDTLTTSTLEEEQSVSDAAAQEAQETEEDRRAVRQEIKNYEDAGLMNVHESDHLDLLRYWQERQTRYPLFFRAALDVLPIQASAVPCERVFSSSKETDTMRRANLGQVRMEQLQILKYQYRNERLSFTDELVCVDQELAAFDIDPNHVESLLSSGEIRALQEYIDESQQGWGM